MKEKARKKKIIKLIGAVAQWLVYMFAYTLVFMFVDYVFDSFVVDDNHFIRYSFISVILIYVLNKTVKPILFRLTLPITGLTLGLFYFVNNVIILKIVEFIMNGRIEFNSLPILFFISIVMSFLNVVIENVIVKPFIKKVKSYE
ncbi:MAG: phage holin family protein [Bacilli bacterium]|nr:phage holin family protein [Bacilli bacterium]